MGKFNGFNTGASNMQGLMRQAQRMQQEVARVQEEVGNTDFEASVGGGAVKVVVNGNKEFKPSKSARRQWNRMMLKCFRILSFPQ